MLSSTNMLPPLIQLLTATQIMHTNIINILGLAAVTFSSLASATPVDIEKRAWTSSSNCPTNGQQTTQTYYGPSYTWIVYCNTDSTAGTTIISGGKANVEDCIAWCGNTASCNRVTFVSGNAQGSGTCYLKPGGAARVKKTGVILVDKAA